MVSPQPQTALTRPGAFTPRVVRPCRKRWSILAQSLRANNPARTPAPSAPLFLLLSPVYPGRASILAVISRQAPGSDPRPVACASDRPYRCRWRSRQGMDSRRPGHSGTSCCYPRGGSAPGRLPGRATTHPASHRGAPRFLLLSMRLLRTRPAAEEIDYAPGQLPRRAPRFLLLSSIVRRADPCCRYRQAGPAGLRADNPPTRTPGKQDDGSAGSAGYS